MAKTGQKKKNFRKLQMNVINSGIYTCRSSRTSHKQFLTESCRKLPNIEVMAICAFYWEQKGQYFYFSSTKTDEAVKTEAEQTEGDQAKKGGKKTVKKNEDNKDSSEPSEPKDSTDNKAAEDKGEPNLPPALTKEEEEDLAQQRREERKRKDQEFLNQLTKAVSRSAIQPLGRDRVFRRYWAFKSLRGLFVEDDDPDQHLLLEPESEPESEVSLVFLPFVK